MAHIKQPDEGNTVRLFGFSEYDPSQGHIVCLPVCVWSEILKMREGNKLGPFVLNTRRKEESESFLQKVNAFNFTLLFEAIIMQTYSVKDCHAGFRFTV